MYEYWKISQTQKCVKNPCSLIKICQSHLSIRTALTKPPGIFRAVEVCTYPNGDPPK